MVSATRRGLGGAAIAVAGVAALTAAMVPLRPHLAVATSALVLVVPVVLGVVVGGFRSGAIGVAVGFLAYDLFFIPPYDTLTVGARQNWVALGVYVVVMLAVARVVDRLQWVRSEAAGHAASTRRLFELSDMLIAERPRRELAEVIVATVRAAFDFSAVALLLPAAGEDATEASSSPGDGVLDVEAVAGEPLSEEELRMARPSGGTPTSLVSRVSAPSTAPSTAPGSSWRGARPERLFTVPLVATGQPIGALVARGAMLRPQERELLHTYANQAALALERARLRERVIRAELLEEVDRLRNALMGAVSHDLRTPLATVKAAVSDLRRRDVQLSDEDTDELLALVESQSDRLARLVTNLLDMTRIQTGALVPGVEETTIGELLDQALASLAGTEVPDRVVADFEEDLPTLRVDYALMSQVLVNLLENAGLHAPEGGPIEISARRLGDKVEVAVRDQGPGIAPEDRERVFQMFNRVSGAGRAGLGLAIARAFVEAHGERIVAREAPGGGAELSFTVPIAFAVDAEPEERASSSPPPSPSAPPSSAPPPPKRVPAPGRP